MMRDQYQVPGEEETLLVERGSRDRGRDASVRYVLELLDPDLSAQLRICYDYQWLPPHVKPDFIKDSQGHIDYVLSQLTTGHVSETFYEDSYRMISAHPYWNLYVPRLRPSCFQQRRKIFVFSPLSLNDHSIPSILSVFVQFAFFTFSQILHLISKLYILRLFDQIKINKTIE